MQTIINCSTDESQFLSMLHKYNYRFWSAKNFKSSYIQYPEKVTVLVDLQNTAMGDLCFQENLTDINHIFPDW